MHYQTEILLKVVTTAVLNRYWQIINRKTS